jgi:hypothetical protein
VGKNQMTNLFEQAIAQGELLKFALGKDEYFMADRDYGDHSVINSWISCILPLIEKDGMSFVNDRIEEMFQALLDADIDSNTKSDSLLYHLHVYYYLNNEGRLQARKLAELNPQIPAALEQYIESLRNNSDPAQSTARNTLELIKKRGR